MIGSNPFSRGADQQLQGGVPGVRQGREREHQHQGAGHRHAHPRGEPHRGRAAEPHQQVRRGRQRDHGVHRVPLHDGGQGADIFLFSLLKNLKKWALLYRKTGHNGLI